MRSDMSNLEAALAYAERGLGVIPIQAGGKAPACAHGYKDATTDPDQITEWFSSRPEWNLGIATGVASGVVVFDYDIRNDRSGASLAVLQSLLSAEDALRVLTASGGFHGYTRSPGFKLPRKIPGLPGIDVQSDGQYVVAPPSRRAEGDYSWMGKSILELDPPPIPEALLERLMQKPTPSPRDAAEVAGKIKEGGRNTQLTSLAGTLRRRGLDGDAIEAALQGINQMQCNPPLPEDEVARIARSIANYAPHYERTELGNARRFVDKYGDQIRYCTTWRKWLVWDGTRWVVDETDKVIRMAKDVVEAISAEAEAMSDGEINR